MPTLFWIKYVGCIIIIVSHNFSVQDFNKTIGRFYQSVFVPDSSLALTGTSEGHCIVWENGGNALVCENVQEMVGRLDFYIASDDEPHIKRGVKLMKLHDSPLTVMCITLRLALVQILKGGG